VRKIPLYGISLVIVMGFSLARLPCTPTATPSSRDASLSLYQLYILIISVKAKVTSYRTLASIYLFPARGASMAQPAAAVASYNLAQQAAVLSLLNNLTLQAPRPNPGVPRKIDANRRGFFDLAQELRFTIYDFYFDDFEYFAIHLVKGEQHVSSTLIKCGSIETRNACLKWLHLSGSPWIYPVRPIRLHDSTVSFRV
jgi:hypothetical protein